MNKLGRKLTIRISLVIIIIFSLTMIINNYFLPKYYLYKTKTKVEEIAAEIEKMNKATFISSIESLNSKYNTTIVYDGANKSEAALNLGLKSELEKQKITISKFWITKEMVEKVKDGGIVTLGYSQEKLKSSFFASFVQKEDILVVVGISVAYLSETLGIVNQFNLYMLILSLISIIILVGVLSKRITDPLMELKDITKDIAALEFKKVDIKTDDEIEELAVSINEMSEQLQEAHEELLRKNKKLKGFTADITHELKTPLALIKAYSLGIQDGLDDGTYLDTIVKQSDNISNLIEVLLNFSKMERDDLHKTVVNMKELFQRCLSKHEIEIVQKGICLTVETDSVNCWDVVGDKDRLEIVFNNLISNAIKYTNNSNITIVFEEKNEMLAFRITNGVLPIELDQLDKLWDSFYVIEESRNKSISGTGLGLAIVKSILERHRFEYGVTVKKNEITFFVYLPIG